jgi:Skp family chaperone for outer membrane proteins
MAADAGMGKIAWWRRGTVNRKFAIASVVVLGAAVVGASVGGLVGAQPPKPAAPTASASVLGRTRVALVNLHVVMKGYSKFVAFKAQVADKDKQYMDQIQAKQTRLEKLANEAKDKATSDARKSAIEAEMRTVRFDMENIRTEAQKAMLKFQEDQLAQMYREAYQVASEYAAANGIDLVMRYLEDWDDYNLASKVVGRMNMPFWPMYFDRSLEITGPIADLLNKRFGSPATAMPPVNNGIQPVSGPNK